MSNEKEMSVAEIFRKYVKWVADGAIETQPHPDTYMLYGKIAELETKAGRADVLQAKVDEWSSWGNQVKALIDFANENNKNKG